MKSKILYIFSVVILCGIFFLLGWSHQPDVVYKPISNPAPIITKITKNTVADSDEYKSYLEKTDTICPFETTASTGDCLDGEIIKQNKQYNSSSQELLTDVKVKIKEMQSQNKDVYLGLSDILTEVPEYNKMRDVNIQKLCQLQNVWTIGSGIVIDSRRCTIFYNEKDIQMLQRLIFDVNNSIYPD